MIEEEVQRVLLNILYQHFLSDPTRYISRENIEKKTKIDIDTLNATMHYLKGNGFVDLKYELGSNIFHRAIITSSGIDYLKMIEMKHVTKDEEEKYDKIRELQHELNEKVKSKEKYEFSVFISHTTLDYLDLHEFCIKLWENNIEPIFWFQKYGRGVRDKLIKLINDSDLFLIYLTERTIDSAMTNCEIGFAEGKREYKTKLDTIRITKKGFNLDNLRGFYTRGDEIKDIDFSNPQDIISVISILKEKNNDILRLRTNTPDIIQLIHGNEFIKISQLIKNQITEVYNFLSKPTISYSESDFNKILEYYSICRQHVAELKNNFINVIEYYDSKYILENVDLLFEIEKLTLNRSGTTAVIEIPCVLLSEILFDIFISAYKKRDNIVLKKAFTPLSNKYEERVSFIYNRRVWHPEVFHRDVLEFHKTILPLKEDNESPEDRIKVKNYFEMIFLFDAFSSSNKNFYSIPIYMYFEDLDIYNRMERKLQDPTFQKFVQNVFDLSFDTFLKMVISRNTLLIENHQIPRREIVYIPEWENAILKFNKNIDSFLNNRVISK